MPTSAEKSGKLGLRLDNMRKQGSLSRVFFFVMATKKIFGNFTLNYDYHQFCHSENEKNILLHNSSKIMVDNLLQNISAKVPDLMKLEGNNDCLSFILETKP